MSKRILITNDDGIGAPGIAYLASWAKKLGSVTVVAPKYEQSASSHSIILRRPFEFKKSDVLSIEGIDAYTLDAMPADCVRFAADMIGNFDLVFSGINPGYNIGYDIAYSGTCAAAFEGNYAGAKSVAFSTERGNLEQAAKMLDTVWEFFEQNALFERCDMYNVNIAKDMKGIRITRQGATFYRDNFEKCGEDMYKATTYIAHHYSEGGDPYIDTNAVYEGFCSISPLCVNRTENKTFEFFNK